ncbi:FAD dependent oxidoreductase domain-containing protein [Ditylenchus destructor]|nr:FAD dependent oxidoreductase domain-containing protein [Ditylenchus destructor]
MLRSGVLNVAIVGEGVIGISTALAIKEAFPSINLTIFSDRNFEDTTSYGPPGIWCPHYDNEENRKWEKASFDRFTKIEKEHSPEETGVKLISGYLQSDVKETIETEERHVKNTAYNFHVLTDREIEFLFPNLPKHACHYTTYAAEGRRYVPWMKRQLQKFNGVQFRRQKLSSLKDIIDGNDETFDVVINCAGIDGGKLAGDDNSCYPIRGVVFEVRIPWHRHFIIHESVSVINGEESRFSTYSFPLVDSILLGGVFQENRWIREVTNEDREDIWRRVLEVHPNFKDYKNKVISEWCGLRPGRPNVRLEKSSLTSESGRVCHVIHNYGHGGNGFTLGWGCAQDVVALLKLI